MAPMPEGARPAALSAQIPEAVSVPSGSSFSDTLRLRSDFVFLHTSCRSSESLPQLNYWHLAHSRARYESMYVHILEGMCISQTP